MKLDWIEYSKELWNNQPLPPVRRKVLVQVAAGSRPGMPPIVAVGYRKNAAGEDDSPYFVVPGVGGPVTHWADCLGDDFHAPLWSSSQPAVAPPEFLRRSLYPVAFRERMVGRSRLFRVRAHALRGDVPRVGERVQLLGRRVEILSVRVGMSPGSPAWVYATILGRVREERIEEEVAL